MAEMYEVIDRLLDERGVNGAQMSSDLGMSRSFMTELRKGRAKSIKVETAQKIAEYFRVTIDYLLGNDEDGRALEIAKWALSQFVGQNPDALSGARLDVLFEVSGYDLDVVCFNLGIDQSYLNSWIEDNDLPPKPITDKILGVFRLRPEDLLAEKELADYWAESAEWGGIEIAPTVSGKRLFDSSAADDLTSMELELIRKFRRLDDRGQAAVLNVLNHEYETRTGENAVPAPKEA